MVKWHTAKNCAGRWLRHGEGGSEKNRPEQCRADQRSKSLDGSKSQRGGVFSDCLRTVLPAFIFEMKRIAGDLSFISSYCITRMNTCNAPLRKANARVASLGFWVGFGRFGFLGSRPR